MISKAKSKIPVDFGTSILETCIFLSLHRVLDTATVVLGLLLKFGRNIFDNYLLAEFGASVISNAGSEISIVFRTSIRLNLYLDSRN